MYYIVIVVLIICIILVARVKQRYGKYVEEMERITEAEIEYDRTTKHWRCNMTREDIKQYLTGICGPSLVWKNLYLGANSCDAAHAELSPELLSVLVTGLEILEIPSYKSCLGKVGNINVEFCMFYNEIDPIGLHLHIFCGLEKAKEFNMTFDNLGVN